MAKKKKGRRKQGWMSKAFNVGLLLLTFARPLQLLLNNISNPGEAAKQIAFEATGGLVEGRLDLTALARFYTPAVGAGAIAFLKRYAMRHYPVR